MPKGDPLLTWAGLAILVVSYGIVITGDLSKVGDSLAVGLGGLGLGIGVLAISLSLEGRRMTSDLRQVEIDHIISEIEIYNRDLGGGMVAMLAPLYRVIDSASEHQIKLLSSEAEPFLVRMEEEYPESVAEARKIIVDSLAKRKAKIGAS